MKTIERTYTFAQPGRIVFGFGVSGRVGKEIKSMNAGSRVQIITDAALSRMGMVDDVLDSLKKAGMETEVWDKVEGEPTQSLIEECCREVRDFNADVFVGFGGGSSIDVAKIVAGLMTNPGRLHEYFMKDTGVGRFKNPIKPLLAIPTTAGTGAENTWLAVTGLEGVEGKVGFADPKIIPLRAIVDPGLTMSMPPRITASTGIDAFTHLIEPAINANNNPFTQALAMQGVRTIPVYLPRAYRDGGDREARFHMMMQATFGGLSLNYGGVNEGHLVGQMIGGRYHIPHGVAQGVALPYCLGYNLDAFPEGIAQLARGWGLDVEGLDDREAGMALINACVDLLKTLNMPWKLSQIEGIKKEHLSEIAEAIASTPYFVTTAASCCWKISTKEDYLVLLERMYHGVLEI